MARLFSFSTPSLCSFLSHLSFHPSSLFSRSPHRKSYFSSTLSSSSSSSLRFLTLKSLKHNHQHRYRYQHSLPSSSILFNSNTMTSHHTDHPNTTDFSSTFNSHNMSEFVQVNHKVFYAAADRNKHAILNQLDPIFKDSQLVLEVGSGSGQHVVFFGQKYPDLVFQPTEYDINLFSSIEAYTIQAGLQSTIKTPLELDTTNEKHWSRVLEAGQQEHVTSCSTSTTTTSSSSILQQGQEQGVYDLVWASNVFHISAWQVSEGMIRGAGKVLKSGGVFAVYGPFKKDGEFGTDSNQQFDATLRERDASWGVRDMEAVTRVAKESKLGLWKVVEMPSNNYMLFYKKEHGLVEPIEQ